MNQCAFRHSLRKLLLKLSTNPFGVLQIAWIAAEPAIMLHAVDISPGHRGLHRIFINPTKLHPTDITQRLSKRDLETSRYGTLQPIKTVSPLLLSALSG